MLTSIAFTAIATSLRSIANQHMYSEDALFEYPSHHRLSWQVCPDCPGKCWSKPPRLPSKSLPIHHSRFILTIEVQQFCVTDPVSKYSTKGIHERREIFMRQT